jgi:hypothetical protein
MTSNTEQDLRLDTGTGGVLCGRKLRRLHVALREIRSFTALSARSDRCKNVSPSAYLFCVTWTRLSRVS